MGATTFIETGKGSSADHVFVRLVDAAKDEFGRGGYTGTIAEKKAFEVLDRDKLYDTVDAAIERANELIQQEDPSIEDKWGPAGCLRVKDGHYVFFGWASE